MIKKIIFTSPDWHLNGVNVFTSHLAKQLIKKDYDVEILLTQKDLKSIYREKNMPLDKSLPIKELKVKTSRKHYWKSHWDALKKYLEQSSPCIYIPNYDFCHASICPVLDDSIITVGIVHSDDEAHYEQTRRLGRFWNAIVTVSDDIHCKVKEFDSQNNDKLFKIDYGVNVCETYPERTFKNSRSPIKIVYTGRLIEHQKRVSDLPKIMNLLCENGINYVFNIVGNGPQENELKRECKEFVNKGLCFFHGILSNEKVYEILRQSHILILTSEFEGKPLSVIEAMSQGCVPVVSKTESGIPELIRNGYNGFSIPIGNIEKFADCIVNLNKNRNKLEKLSENAFRTVKESGYNVEEMAKKYIDIFNFAEKRQRDGNFNRPKGDIYPPNFLQVTPDILHTVSWKITAPLRKLGDKIIQLTESN